MNTSTHPGEEQEPLAPSGMDGRAGPAPYVMSARMRAILIAIGVVAMIAGGVALMLRAPFGSSAWQTRLIEISGPPVGFLLLTKLLGKRFVRDAAQRPMLVYAGFAGIALYAAVQQFSAPIYYDVRAYQPRAEGYEFRRELAAEEALLEALKGKVATDLSADEVRAFVVHQRAQDIGIVGAVDLRSTRDTDDVLKEAAQQFAQSMRSAGAEQAAPIQTDRGDVMVFGDQGDRVGSWLRSNLLIFAEAAPDDIEPLVVSLGQSD